MRQADESRESVYIIHTRTHTHTGFEFKSICYGAFLKSHIYLSLCYEQIMLILEAAVKYFPVVLSVQDPYSLAFRFYVTYSIFILFISCFTSYIAFFNLQSQAFGLGCIFNSPELFGISWTNHYF